MNDKPENPTITVIAYSKDRFTSAKVSSLSEALKIGEYDVVWVNVDTLSLLQDVIKVLGVHERPIKHLGKAGSRARVFVFPDYLFILLHQVYEMEGNLKRERIGILLKDNIVVTIQERRGDVFNPVRESIREGEGLLRESGGADYLLFALLEAVVENYVPIIERISSRWRNSKCRYSHGGTKAF